MKNLARQLNFYLTFILFAIFTGIFYFLYNFRYGLELYIYIGTLFLVALTSLKGGILAGLMMSILAIFVYAGTFFYYSINSSRIFDITFTQGLWLILYLFTAIFIGKVGDGIKFYSKMHKKYPQEMLDLMQDFVFHVTTQKMFNKCIEEEIARSTRMQGKFTLALVSIQEISELTRVFGKNGIYEAANKVKFYLRAIVKENDKVTKPNNTSFEILFAQLGKDEVLPRLSHLTAQLENTYLEYKKATLKFPIKIFVGLASFPDDGNEVYHLRNKVESNLASLTCKISPAKITLENL